MNRSISRTVPTLTEWKSNISNFKKFSSTIWPSKPNIRIDNLILILHSVVTVQILLSGTLFVSMKQYFGDPIDCMSRDSDIKPSMLEHYCWLEGAFSLVDPALGSSAYPGVRSSQSSSEQRNHHKYYQWVYFVLMIQAALFYLPKHIWRLSESGRIKNLIIELSKKSVQELDESSRIRLVQEVADNLSISSSYLHTILFCEVLCFIHLLGEIWFTDIFLNGAFLELGLRWLAYANHESEQDPLIRAFPRMVKCSFHRYGFSGTIETKDALCFLPLNIVNEKIYTVLWFWFMALSLMTFFHMSYELALVAVKQFRWHRLMTLAPSASPAFIRRISSNRSSWFILRLIASHIKPSHFRDLIRYIERDHYDPKGRPLHVSRFGEALARKMLTKVEEIEKKNYHNNSNDKSQSKSILKSALKKVPTHSNIHKTSSASANDDWKEGEWGHQLDETTNLTSNYESSYNANRKRDRKVGGSCSTVDEAWTLSWPEDGTDTSENNATDNSKDTEQDSSTQNNNTQNNLNAEWDGLAWDT